MGLQYKTRCGTLGAVDVATQLSQDGHGASPGLLGAPSESKKIRELVLLVSGTADVANEFGNIHIRLSGDGIVKTQDIPAGGFSVSGGTIAGGGHVGLMTRIPVDFDVSGGNDILVEATITGSTVIVGEASVGVGFSAS